jgi:hypothetical protein
VTSPPSVKPEENAKREKNMKTIPVRSQQETKKKDSGLTSVRVRINESGLLVRSIVVRGRLTISMKCLGHEALRGHVQCVYRITTVPISLSLVAQACLLENLRRLDTMIVEKVAKKGRHTITRLGARFVERRASCGGGALVTQWSSGMVATPCSRVALVRVAASLAGAIILDESERHVFVVVEVVQDLVVSVTEKTISRSLEGSHEDRLQNVFDGKVTNVAHGAVKFGHRGEMMVDSDLGVVIPAYHAGDFAGEQNSLGDFAGEQNSLWSSGKVVRRASHTFWAHSCWAEPWVSKTFIALVRGAQRS